MPVGVLAALALMLGFVLVSVGLPQPRGGVGVAAFDRTTVLLLAAGGLLIAAGLALAFLRLPLLRPFWLLYLGGSVAIWVVAFFERDDGFSFSGFLTSALLAALVLRLLILHFRG